MARRLDGLLLPQLRRQAAAGAADLGRPPAPRQYNLIYADNIQLFGASIAKNIAGISTSAEISYRKNTPLNAQVLGIAQGLPGQGDTKGPRGDTCARPGERHRHDPEDASVRCRGLGRRAGLVALASVNSGANLFNGVGYAPCAGRDKWDGCSTRNYVGIGASFNPTWFRSFPESTCRRR